MMKKQITRFLSFMVLLLAVNMTVSAQVTSGTITGTVKDPKGVVLTGATVEAIHEPSGSKYKTVSGTSGKFNLPGLRVGGPYKLTITYVGFQVETITDIYVQLGVPSSVDVALRDNTTQLKEVTVAGTSRKGALISKEVKGTGTNINKRLIAALPTLSRSITDITRLTPQSNGTSFAGQDNRAINFTLDGSIFNNSFGLSALNGGQTNSTPISLDAIEELQINLSPYNLKDAGFTGASINAVTKSGTNTFHGTGFYNNRNQGLVGTKAGTDGTQDVTVTNFDVKQYGVSVGGPIIKNKAFFFLNYEAERRTDPGTLNVASTGSNTGANVTRVRASALDSLKSFLTTNFGYNPGDYQGYNFLTKSDKAVARFDFNLSDKHKLSIRGNFLESKRDVVVSNSGTFSGSRNSLNAMSFSNTAYEINNNIYGVIGQLNSRFSNRISNELTFGYTANRDFRAVKGGNFPTVDIQDGGQANANGTTYTTFGNDPFTPNNKLYTDTWQFSDNLTAYLGGHTLTAGVAYESFKFLNGFTPQINGTYTFASLSDFYTAANAYLANPNLTTSPVVLKNYQAAYSNLPGGAVWYATTQARQISAYVQDEVTIDKKLNLTYGVRFEVPYFVGSGYVNTQVDGLNFVDENGNPTKLSTSKLPTAKLMISPRIGFNYDVKGDRTVQVRGGAGLFTGRPSFVFISNQIGNNGVLNGSVSSNNTTAYPFRPTAPATYPNFVPNPGVPAASYNIATTQQDFRFPQVFRSNLAVDFKIYKDIVGSVEGLFTQSLSNIFYYNANLKPSTSNFTGPDNRPRFAGSTATRINASNPTITDATVMKSGAYGGSFNSTFKIEKPVKAKGLGWLIAYNYSSAKDYISPGSIAFSSWSGNKSVNGNNRPDLSYSDNDIRNRWITNISYRFELAKTAALQFTLFGQIQNQGRFSYTYNGDMNGDNISGNDLMYIPKNQSEMNFVQNGTLTPQQQNDAFDAYINQDKYLSKNRGKYAERNGALLPSVARFDLSVKLELFRNIGGNRNTIQLTGDIFNVGNLINHKYGVGDVVNNSSPVTFNAVDANGLPSFKFSPQTVNGVSTLNYSTLRKGTSLSDVWQAQFGVRYIF
ncbi:carboxypeptidase regulatory-like domain-containing protein [Parasediminibacterium paludis]|uniref:Carboxypeptidase regulatory-like domain-containing protein n=1 Tax=Parasediminibacterium paludis TaxID=908966 RepID=A0ABV8PRS3_9BACT